jgi:subtilase family serine protease
MHVRRPHTARGRIRRTAAIIALTAITAGGLTAAGVSSAQAAGLVTYASAVPGWAKKANVTSSSASTTTQLQAEMFLDLQDQQGAEDLATAVSDPSSSQYRQYLSPSAWIAAYSPTQATFNSKVAFLTSEGFHITGSPASRQYIVFTGTQAQMNAAFSTKLETYNVNGQKLVAPSTAPSLPVAVASGVASLSLDQGRLLTRPETATQAAPTNGVAGLQNLSAKLSTPKSASISTPCSTYTGQHTVALAPAYGSSRFGTANCGYTPAQLRAITKTSQSSGSGQTVAIVGVYDSPTTVTDVNTYSRLKGQSGFATGQYTNISPSRSTFTMQSACGWASGWQVEQTLDVESVHAVAPSANVIYSGASDCQAGPDLALSKILDQGLATIVSNSYGGVGEYQGTGADGAAYMAGEENIEIQAAGEGIGLYFASGDDGDESVNLPYRSVDFPASSPWVTAVGGTAVGLSKTNTKVFETGWGDSLDQVAAGKSGKLAYRSALPGFFAGGAGGGSSYTYAKPSYQSTVATSSTKRNVPDVAALADPYTGFSIGYHPITNNASFTTGAWRSGVAGGTSLATPIFAAQMAVVQQVTGARVGFANPILYKLHTTSPATLTDVVNRAKPYAAGYTSGGHTYLVTFGADSSLGGGAGYDNQTGLGDLNLSNVSGFATPSAG